MKRPFAVHFVFVVPALLLGSLPAQADELLINPTFQTSPALAPDTASTVVARADAGANTGITLDGTSTYNLGWYGGQSSGEFTVETPAYAGNPAINGNVLDLSSTAGSGGTYYELSQQVLSLSTGANQATMSFGYDGSKTSNDSLEVLVYDVDTGQTPFSDVLAPGTGETTVSSTFAITPGDALLTMFVENYPAGQSTYPDGFHIDNVMLYQAPEPSTFALLGLGLGVGAVALAQRRQRVA